MSAELAGTTIEPTPHVLANAYIASDPARPGRLAIYYAAEHGRHPVVADDFTGRGEAERWLEYHKARGGDGE